MSDQAPERKQVATCHIKWRLDDRRLDRQPSSYEAGDVEVFARVGITAMARDLNVDIGYLGWQVVVMLGQQVGHQTGVLIEISKHLLSMVGGIGGAMGGAIGEALRPPGNVTPAGLELPPGVTMPEPAGEVVSIPRRE